METTTESAVELHPELVRLCGLDYPGDKARLLLTLNAFMDESHDEKKQAVYCVSGFLASVETWNRLWPRWEKMRDDAKISAFHMTDCVNGWGSFEGMSGPDREDLQRRAIELIMAPDIPVAGVACGVLLEAHERLRPEIEEYRFIPEGASVRGSIGDPYFTAFQHAVQAVSELRLSGFWQHVRIDFVFDRTELDKRAGHLYQKLLESPNLSYAPRLGRLSFDDKERILPLQVADILAYESYRNLHDSMLGGQPERWQMAALRPKIADFSFLDEKHLREMIEAMRQRRERRLAGEQGPQPPKSEP